MASLLVFRVKTNLRNQRHHIWLRFIPYKPGFPTISSRNPKTRTLPMIWKSHEKRQTEMYTFGGLNIRGVFPFRHQLSLFFHFDFTELWVSSVSVFKKSNKNLKIRTPCKANFPSIAYTASLSWRANVSRIIKLGSPLYSIVWSTTPTSLDSTVGQLFNWKTQLVESSINAWLPDLFQSNTYRTQTLTVLAGE